MRILECSGNSPFYLVLAPSSLAYKVDHYMLSSTDLLMLEIFFGYLVFFPCHPVRFKYQVPGVYVQSMYTSFATGKKSELDASWDHDSKYHIIVFLTWRSRLYKTISASRFTNG